jgi:predicted XRE-type DNA-binding protein
MSSALTTQLMSLADAAELLNVSQSHLMNLLAKGMVTLDIADLVKYKAEQAKVSQEALQQLVDQAQELNMGY